MVRRYYLEPASPLKSLPQHTNNNTNNGALINGLSNGSIGHNSSVPIALTPPASLRLAASTRHAAAAAKSNGTAAAATTTTTTTHQFHTQFTPDDQPAGMFGIKPSNNNPSSTVNGKPKAASSSPAAAAAAANGATVVARHGMSGLSGSQATNGERQAARLSGPPTLSNNLNNNNNGHNKFTPDGDFGTDFGANGLFGGGGGGSKPNGQRMDTTADNANADFADFEHNAIFNAAGTVSGRNAWMVGV